MGMMEPDFMKNGYAYIGEDEQWHIKPDAPEAAKEEFKKFMAAVNPTPDENGIVTQC